MWANAMVTAWLDKDHDSCYLLTDFLHKVDLVTVGKREVELVRVAKTLLEDALTDALATCAASGDEDPEQILHKQLVLLSSVLNLVRIKQSETMHEGKDT